MLEALVFYRQVMHTLTGQEVGKIMLPGEITRQRLLAQLKADMLNLPLLLPSEGNASAFGAALLAGLGSGFLLLRRQQ